MSVSASEVEKMESSKKTSVRRRYTEEFRIEAVQYYRKAREIDPKKTIKECAAELGINEKTFNDWVLHRPLWPPAQPGVGSWLLRCPRWSSGREAAPCGAPWAAAGGSAGRWRVSETGAWRLRAPAPLLRHGPARHCHCHMRLPEAA